jgi:predicted metal-dependent hydrolase
VKKVSHDSKDSHAHHEHIWKIDGQTIPYLIKVSNRARYVRIEIRPDGHLVVTRPAHVSLSSIEGILSKKKQWIFFQREKLKQSSIHHLRQTYQNGDPFLYMGEEVFLQVSHEEIARPLIRLHGKRLETIIPCSVSKEETPVVLREAIERWYRMEAKRVIPERVHELAVREGLTYNRIFIKGQKTRWGSCSTLGNLNFNWRLMMCPPEVIDYIIIHELCHLSEMNHSQRFWNLVASRCPNYKECERWLKQNGSQIMWK